MDRLVRIVRLTDRVAPGGTWTAGQRDAVPAVEARLLLDAGLVRLDDGETLPSRAAERATCQRAVEIRRGRPWS